MMNGIILGEPGSESSECQGEVAFMSNAWKKKVTVKAEDGPAPGTIKWSLDSELKKFPDKDELWFDKTADKMPKRDYYLLEFDLEDKTKLNLKFAPNPMLAFWVEMGSAFNPEPDCPQKPSYCHEVYATCVDEKRLTVRNEDETIATFRFSLGFLKGGEDPKSQESYVRFDPVGSNRDGGL
jgi:hypothetical protein